MYNLLKPLKALMISMSVGCLRAYQKIILISLRPQIFVCQGSAVSLWIQNFLQICIHKWTGPRNAHTSVMLIHSLPTHCPPHRLHIMVKQAHTSVSCCHRLAICAQTWWIEMRRTKITCVETKPPVSQCYHTLKKAEKPKMSVLLLKPAHVLSFLVILQQWARIKRESAKVVYLPSLQYLLRVTAG